MVPTSALTRVRTEQLKLPVTVAGLTADFARITERVHVVNFPVASETIVGVEVEMLWGVTKEKLVEDLDTKLAEFAAVAVEIEREKAEIINPKLEVVK